MPTEAWFRNPDYYIKECLETGVQNIVWDKGYLFKRSIDVTSFMDLYYSGQSYRALVVEADNTFELRPGYTLRNPYATYPTWAYGDDISILEELMEKNSVDGQEHRVIVSDLPVVNYGLGRKFMRILRELQEEYEHCILHVHGLYSYRVLFGLGYASVDFEPRETAKKGKVYLPNGREMTYEKACEEPQWITLLGFQPHELSVPRNRCMYNIKSVMWAGQHFRENVRFKHRGFTHVNPDDPSQNLPEDQLIFMKRKKPKDGDKFHCDFCSLQLSCKYFRTGAICAVPDSEPQALATFFKTRDADTIIEGLGTLLAAQTRRAEKGLDRESENDDKLDPEVTKIINAVFDRGVTLAKLLNPTLGVPPRGQGIPIPQGGNSQALTSQIVQELVSRGVKLEDITEEMVLSLLNGGAQQAAIEAAAEHHAQSA